MNNISVPKLRLFPIRLVPIMGLALASAAFAQIPAASAVQAPALYISDGVNTVVIDSSATVYKSVGCACTSAAAPTVVAGQITWSGTVGAYTLSSVEGSSHPVLVAPSLDLGIPGGLTANAAGGPLTISWTDVNFTGMAPAAIVATGAVSPSGSVAYSVYIDSSNVPFGQATLVSSATSSTIAANTSSSVAIPSGMFSMTEKEVFTLGAGGFLVNDFGYDLTAAVHVVVPPVTTVSLTKTANVKTISPFQKVTYTYVAKNTGNVTLTKLTITDDNATPSYTGDDFTVCTIASLAPGASQTCTASVYPPVTEGANDTSSWGGNWGNGNGWGWGFNYNNVHPGGTLICKSQPNGNVQFTYLVDSSITDNTFGSGSASSWGWGGGSFSNLLNNGGAEFQILDGKGNTVLDFVADYVSVNSSYPSGYGTCGVKSNGGCIYSGNSKNIVSIDTSITDNLNRSKAFNKCTQNSPTGNPDWQSQCGYKVEVNCAAWGSNGFGGVNCPIVQHTAKNSNCSQHQIKPICSTATNTATLTAYYGATELAPVKATATVSIVASQQGGTSDCWGNGYSH
jgi:hypothetical protein